MTAPLRVEVVKRHGFHCRQPQNLFSLECSDICTTISTTGRVQLSIGRATLKVSWRTAFLGTPMEAPLVGNTAPLYHTTAKACSQDSEVACVCCNNPLHLFFSMLVCGLRVVMNLVTTKPLDSTSLRVGCDRCAWKTPRHGAP
jgi:hypothetical protein